MKIVKFKHLFLAAGILWAGTEAQAQYLRTSYFMEGTSSRLQMNPGLQPTRGYFNFPVIGSLNVGASSNVLGTGDIIDVLDSGEDLYTNDKLYNRLKADNRLNVNLNTDILSFGWYKGKNFWSFNVGVRTDIGAELTRNLFTFLNEMDGVEDNWRNSAYDISHQQVNINAYAEVGLGFARQINNRLTVGARLKGLIGAANLELNLNNVSMNADLPSDMEINQWQDPNYWRKQSAEQIQEFKNKFDAYYANLNVNAELRGSFKGLELVKDPTNTYIEDIEFNENDLGIAGYGFGVDLGASYKVLNNLTVSAAILDLGFISWSKSASKIASANPDPIALKGSDYTAGIDPSNPQTVVAAVNKLQEDANGYMDRVTGGDVLDFEMMQLKESEVKDSRKSRLASTLVLGAEYGFFNNKLAVGVLSTTRFVEPKTLSELTFSANYRPKNWFNLAVSYSAIQSAGKSFGLAMKLGPLFVGTDYMFLGKNSNSVNGFVGISFPMGGKKKQG